MGEGAVSSSRVGLEWGATNGEFEGSGLEEFETNCLAALSSSSLPVVPGKGSCGSAKIGCSAKVSCLTGETTGGG